MIFNTRKPNSAENDRKDIFDLKFIIIIYLFFLDFLLIRHINQEKLKKLNFINLSI